MLRFPKRARSKSIDLEDGDFVLVDEVGAALEPDDLADTGVVPPKARARGIAERAPLPARPATLAKASSLAPVAMTPPSAFPAPRFERLSSSLLDALGALAGSRPSLPWAAALLILGAAGAAGSMRLLDSLEGPSREGPPAAAAALPAPLPIVASPHLAAPPVVLRFGSSDALNVAVDAPRPAPAPPPPASAPQPAAAPAPLNVNVAVAAGSPGAKKGSASPAPPTTPALPATVPLPGDPAKRAATAAAPVDSLAQEQLKAALK